MKYKTLPDQTLFDIAVQETGDIENVFDLLHSIKQGPGKKQIGLTDIPQPGTVINIEETNNTIVNMYKNDSHEIATGMTHLCLLMDSEAFVLKDSDGAILTVNCN